MVMGDYAMTAMLLNAVDQRLLLAESEELTAAAAAMSRFGLPLVELR